MDLVLKCPFECRRAADISDFLEKKQCMSNKDRLDRLL